MHTLCSSLPKQDRCLSEKASAEAGPVPPPLEVELSGSNRRLVSNSSGGVGSYQRRHPQSLPTLDRAFRHSTHQQQAASSKYVLS